MRGALTPMHRDFRRLARLAEEILRQCRHYERNQEKLVRRDGDDIRALLVSQDSRILRETAARMERRWRRAKTKREAIP